MNKGANPINLDGFEQRGQPMITYCIRCKSQIPEKRQRQDLALRQCHGRPGHERVDDGQRLLHHVQSRDPARHEAAWGEALMTTNVDRGPVARRVSVRGR